jgi:hypothetical protein
VPAGDDDVDDLFEDLGDFYEAKRWVHAVLRLREDPELSVHPSSDPDRAGEFVRFYFEHPELRGWRRHLCAEVATDSVIELIDPERIDERDAAPDDVAEALVGRLLSDRLTGHYLLNATRPEMRALGFYRRLSAVVDRVSGGGA